MYTNRDYVRELCGTDRIGWICEQLAHDLDSRDTTIRMLKKELLRLKNQCRWISVKESFPPTAETVWVWDGEDITEGFHELTGWYDDNGDEFERPITHWRKKQVVEPPAEGVDCERVE